MNKPLGVHILQEIYDSEINFTITSFWDGGFNWKLGDELNGFKAEGDGTTIDSVITQLTAATCLHFPKSRFASMHEEIPMNKLDKKFYGNIRKVKDDTTVPIEQWVVFLAKDNAFADIVKQYPKKCEELGCDKEQIEAAYKLVEDIEEWRSNHPELCKIPDAHGERLLHDKW